ncbi:MAG: leucyl/phenylalanyl-tRNA--protein transferase, partial [Verrucomicrobiales bacterium]
RAIIEFHHFHVSRSLRRSLKKFDVTADLCFREVMERCAEPAPKRETTWIEPEFIDAYTAMHEAGHAHSLECWLEGKLVGGLYGVALGGYFVGESMFSRVDDASKVILAYLVPHLKRQGYRLFDIQMPTRVTVQLGGTVIPRVEFLKRLHDALEARAQFGLPGKLEYHV